MRQIILIYSLILLSCVCFGQNLRTIKGIAVEKNGVPIPYCYVSVKGTKIQATTNKCGEFELTTGEEEFTIVFNCMQTHDFRTFEKRINPVEIHKGETVVFKIKEHGKIFLNNECLLKPGKGLRKIIIR